MKTQDFLIILAYLCFILIIVYALASFLLKILKVERKWTKSLMFIFFAYLIIGFGFYLLESIVNPLGKEASLMDFRPILFWPLTTPFYFFDSH